MHFLHWSSGLLLSGPTGGKLPFLCRHLTLVQCVSKQHDCTPPPQMRGHPSVMLLRPPVSATRDSHMRGATTVRTRAPLCVAFLWCSCTVSAWQVFSVAVLSVLRCAVSMTVNAAAPVGGYTDKVRNVDIIRHNTGRLCHRDPTLPTWNSCGQFAGHLICAQTAVCRLLHPPPQTFSNWACFPLWNSANVLPA